MAALEPHFMAILKKVLSERFVPYLPTLQKSDKQADEQAAKQLSRAFSAFALHKLFDLSPQDAAKAVVDDFHDKGLDAIYYDAKTETLYLLQTKLKESEQFKQEDALPFCEGVRLLLKPDLSNFNQNVLDRKAEIEGYLDTCTHICLLVPYTGDGVSKTASDALESLLNDTDLDEERLEKIVQYYCAADITRDLLAEKAYKPVHADIFLHKHQKVESPKATYYGVAKLADLVALHQVHGKALYERNIRYFLGSGKSDVNKSIKATLQDSPENFFYLNNGVTAVCEQIEPKGRNQSIGVRKFKVRGFSIINGAQTVASAAEFVKEYPARQIDDAKVMLTLINAASDSGFGKQITKARNHQNPVQTANFASLDENQERLRQEIAYLGWQYHYRPELAPTNSIGVIKLDEAVRALALLQHNIRYPVLLKKDASRLSDPNSEEYKAIFLPKLTGSSLINAVLLDRDIRRLLQVNDNPGEMDRLTYRHGALAIASVMMKRLRRKIDSGVVLAEKDISLLISHPFDDLRQKAADLARTRLFGIGPLAFFRNFDRAIPYQVELMKQAYGLAHFQLTTSPEGLHRLAQEKKTPEQDLAERLAKSAPQL